VSVKQSGDSVSSGNSGKMRRSQGLPRLWGLVISLGSGLTIASPAWREEIPGLGLAKIRRRFVGWKR
jgi:hypothetical protein